MRSQQFHTTRASAPVTAGRALIVIAAAIAVLAPSAAADDGDPEWSQLAPLASRSLLLGVAAGDGRLVAVGERGHVLISDDDGATWTQVVVPTRSTLTGVSMLDRERGWAVGHDAVILRTVDGGQTWERVHWAPEEETPLFDVWFADADEGCAIGAYGSYYVTDDGGDSWSFEPISESGFDPHLHRLAESADGGRFYIAAEAGILYRSDDGRATWQELPSPYEGSYFGVLPLEGDAVLLYGLRGHLFRSEDAGESWTEVDTGTSAMLTDGIVLFDGTIVVVGLGGTVLISEDGGRSFAGPTPEDRRGIAAVAEGAPGTIVMVGEFGVRTASLRELTAPADPAEGGGGR